MIDSLTCPHKYGSILIVKTTLEIPDAIFRRARSEAAQRGISLREFVAEAMREKLAGRDGSLEKP